MTTLSDATIGRFAMQAQHGDDLRLSRLNRPTLLNRDVILRLQAAARDRAGLVIASARVGEIAFDNRGGVAADPDIVAVALHKAPRTGLGSEVTGLPNSMELPRGRGGFRLDWYWSQR